MGDFPNVFKHIREKSGLTQQQLANSEFHEVPLVCTKKEKENQILKH